MNSWPFDQSPNTAALTTRQVLDNKAAIRVVIHYADDNSWAFLCGETDGEKDGRVIAMSEAVKLDSSLLQVADLPPGWRAERAGRDGEWARTEFKNV